MTLINVLANPEFSELHHTMAIFEDLFDETRRRNIFESTSAIIPFNPRVIQNESPKHKALASASKTSIPSMLLCKIQT